MSATLESESSAYLGFGAPEFKDGRRSSVAIRMAIVPAAAVAENFHCVDHSWNVVEMSSLVVLREAWSGVDVVGCL